MNYEDLEIKRIEKPPHPKENPTIKLICILTGIGYSILFGLPITMLLLAALGWTGFIALPISIGIIASAYILIETYNGCMDEEIEKYNAKYNTKNS